EIIAQAGTSGTVTIATNMAGRGTDIVLGGNFEAEIKNLDMPDNSVIDKIKSDWKLRHQQVLDSGGLRIIGTERHESRRIDNQLRGRAGRQGDPGSSRFYLSLEDNLMRIFASDKVASIMQKLGMEEGEAIESGLVTKAIENAQRKVEAHNFDMRKHLLQYDDVANDQRKVIYEWRSELLETDNIAADVQTMRNDVVDGLLDSYIPSGSLEEMWDTRGLQEALDHEFGAAIDINKWLEEDSSLNEESLREKVIQHVDEITNEREKVISFDLMRRIERDFMLDVLDRHWKEHLIAMDHLRQGIGLRSYAAKKPEQEFKREAFEMFEKMLDNIKQEVINILAKVQVRSEQDVEAVEHRASEQKMNFNHPSAPNALTGESENSAGDDKTPYVRDERKVGRNEPCPCGSGKKYKQCHGKLA
ncbi:MAG: preprotein translocase subunit SecA, partial [Gammaproteobacteria bacterium]